MKYKKYIFFNMNIIRGGGSLPSVILTKTCDSSEFILNVLVYNIILFMNLSRSYEGNKSGTTFVAERIDALKG